MKTIQDLLREKEAEFQQVQRELEAIKLVIRLLGGEAEADASLASAPAGVPIAVLSRMPKGNGHAVADLAIRQFP